MELRRRVRLTLDRPDTAGPRVALLLRLAAPFSGLELAQLLGLLIVGTDRRPGCDTGGNQCGKRAERGQELRYGPEFHCAPNLERRTVPRRS
jgi:hypothetical protein